MTGGLVDTATLDAGYWFESLRRPVLFGSAMGGLLGAGFRVFVEVSGHPVLGVGMGQCVEEAGVDAVVLGTLRRGEGGWGRFLLSVGEAWVRGVGVDWSAAFGRGPGRRVGLPTYPFQRRHYWLSAQSTADSSSATQVTGFGPGDAAGPRQEPADSADADLATQLAGMSSVAAERMVLSLVHRHVAVVAGHDTVDTVDVRLPFRELGFDSPMLMDLKGRLQATTGLRLPSSVLFDHPTPAALAAHLRVQILGVSGEQAAALPVAPAPAGRGRADRHRRHGLPVPRRRALAGGPVAAGGRRRDAMSPFPTDRGWDLAGLYDPDPDRPGTSYVRDGGFLDDAAGFDAEFFGISPREALAMDPQQRLLLETSWEAFERAGIDPATAARQPDRRLRRRDVPRLRPPGCDAAGRRRGLPAAPATPAASPPAGSPTRFGLEGPAVTVDTACSSSLVALHLAGQALRQGECSLALAGGVDRDGHARHRSSSSAASAGSPPTAAASRSRPPPTAPAGREGVGRAAPGAAVGRAAQRAPGARRGARQRGQPGRRVQRPDRAERPVPAAGDPAGAGQRRAVGRPRSTRSRRTAPAPRSATRSRRRRCSPPTARTGRRTGRCGSAR